MIDFVCKRELFSKTKSPCPAITIPHCPYGKSGGADSEKEGNTVIMNGAEVVRFRAKSLQATIEFGPCL